VSERKKKLTSAQKKKRGKLAEKLKGKKGVKNPFALAGAQEKKGRRKK